MKSISPNTIRYQQYSITLKLNPNTNDMLNQTYNSKSLGKKLFQLWVCCANNGCNVVYDVINDNDTQRNVHLSHHHLVGVTPMHSSAAIHHARRATMHEANEVVVKKNMIVHRLVQLRITRFFIKKMVSFSVYEDRAYHE